MDKTKAQEVIKTIGEAMDSLNKIYDILIVTDYDNDKMLRIEDLRHAAEEDLTALSLDLDNIS